MLRESILLVGSGYMAIEYAKVLKELKKEFIVIGRGEKSASNFLKQTGITVVQGGLQNWLNNQQDEIPLTAIVACSVLELKECTMNLLAKGCKNILLEKPGGINLEDLQEMESIRELKKAQIFIAYNRRYYSSVLQAKRIIKEDGGVQSFTFEFTEWSHKIEPLDIPSQLKENWFYANSTHVVDLAFFMGGEPKELYSYVSGGLPWHSKASIFVGAGKTISGSLFSYHSNWESPGRWKIELMTKNHRILLSPLEKLQIQIHGSLEFTEIDLKENYDIKFKPGVFLPW